MVKPHVAALSWRWRLTMIGAAGGSIPFDFFKVLPGAQLTTCFNGGSIALQEVVELLSPSRERIQQLTSCCCFGGE
jgi:hypothetical protein